MDEEEVVVGSKEREREIGWGGVGGRKFFIFLWIY